MDTYLENTCLIALLISAIWTGAGINQMMQGTIQETGLFYWGWLCLMIGLTANSLRKVQESTYKDWKIQILETVETKSLITTAGTLILAVTNIGLTKEILGVLAGMIFSISLLMLYLACKIIKLEERGK